MRILMFIIGVIFSLFGNQGLFVTLHGDTAHQSTSFVITIGILLWGVVIASAAILNYKGGWQFVLGITLTVTASALSETFFEGYLSGKYKAGNSGFIAISIIVTITLVLGILLLCFSYGKHQRFLSSAREKSSHVRPTNNYQYKISAHINLALRCALTICISVSAISIFCNLMQYALLSEMLGSNGALLEQLTTELQENFQRQAYIDNILMVFTALCFIVLVVWTYRASANANSISDEPLTFQPFQAAAWYFVPLVNCWYPYQTMKEIWQASYRPNNWKEIKPHFTLPLSWLFAVLSSGLPWIVTVNFYGNSQSLIVLTHMTRLLALSNFCLLAACGTALVFTRQIQRMQQLQSSANSPS